MCPTGTVFVPADTPQLADRLRQHFDDGKTVVLVYPDGREVLVHRRRRRLAALLARVRSLAA